MNARQLGRVHRALRKRLLKTQREVSAEARVERNKISEMENGDMSRMRVPELERCFSTLGARLSFLADWNGTALDRLLDAVHAALVGSMVAELRRFGWLVEVEVTFARFSERGSIDILAWHAGSRTLLVVEIKSELSSIEGLLRPLDTKVRLAAVVAAERFGWQPVTVARLVVLPEDRTARRAVSRHASVLDVALPARNRQVRRWLAAPTGDLAALMFLTTSELVGTTRNPSAICRVRKAKPRSDRG